MRGLIIGKFYPPHEGHHFLIDTALSECSSVVVLVLANDVEEPSMPALVRVNMIEAAHPQAHVNGKLKVYHAVDNLPVDYNSRDADRAHAKLIFDALIRVVGDAHDSPWEWLPDVVYSSEEYGPRLASDLNDLYGEPPAWCNHAKVLHRMVDQKRIARPISATKVRGDVIGNWSRLAPSTRASMTRRVVVCGAESTGTTTLARALAERYQTVWVPEWGRTFSESVGLHHVWTSDDFSQIMDEQNRLEDLLAYQAGPVMFCDTDNLATRMFHELYMKSEGPDRRMYHEVERYTLRTLYIVTDHVGVDFEDDGYRLYDSQRSWATNWLEHQLDNLTLPWIKVTGSHDQRMDQAIQEIDKRLKWEFATPVEYQ
jgi:NadR type nicotinamide-nucleotide adenylyltransferase